MHGTTAGAHDPDHTAMDLGAGCANDDINANAGGREHGRYASRIADWARRTMAGALHGGTADGGSAQGTVYL